MSQDVSSSEKSQKLAQLVTQAPPGEVNDVITDIRSIVNDDEALIPHVRPSLRAYNLEQLIVVEHAAGDGSPAHSSILSEASIVPGFSGEEERFVDHEGKRSFKLDHTLMRVDDNEPYELPEAEESFRAELHKSLQAYTKNHFPNGTSSVSCSQYPLLPPEPPVGVSISEPAEAHALEATETETKAADIVTDVVEEQVGEGHAEPAPTPAVGAEAAKHEEVDEPGGLEKVDEEIREANEAESAAGAAAGKSEEPAAETTEGGKEGAKGHEDVAMSEAKSEVEAPNVEESTEENEPPIALPSTEAPTTEAVPVKEVRKQERIENPVYTLQIVGNKYNLNNFWTGRWRTTWVVDPSASEVQGTIKVDVHYFEQGNVQLSTSHSASFPLPKEEVKGQSVASQIVTTISKLETAYHMELNDVYGDLGDKAFRALRRALPVTRQKMDWDKVTGYSLGASLSKAQA